MDMELNVAGELREERYLGPATVNEQLERVAAESEGKEELGLGDGGLAGDGCITGGSLGWISTLTVSASSLQHGSNCSASTHSCGEVAAVSSAENESLTAATTDRQLGERSPSPGEHELPAGASEPGTLSSSQGDTMQCSHIGSEPAHTAKDEHRDSGGRSQAEQCQGESTNVGECTESGSGVPVLGSPSSFQEQASAGGGSYVKVIDDRPPLPAPFEHRCVKLRTGPVSSLYQVNLQEVLGGGRFGSVHRCTAQSSGLQLAMKIIKVRFAKEKESISNEIQVMNQLNHVNLIQLYDAFETRSEMVLVMEYLDGGELFERIIDESCTLTELDAIVYVKQICQGIHYMHHMYVLHLDLKPENILCVERHGNQVKIIDFGLARRYKPREKLRVSFGTPEFLAPEIVNFEDVSFPTDMWSLGVVTYMLLSGLSPFLGNADAETLTNVLTTVCSFDDEAFENISEEAKDFIANLLIREKSGRISAAQCLKHPWLNNIAEKSRHSKIQLKSQLLLKKYVMKRLWKKNYYAIAAANRLKKISSCGSLTALEI
uniref:myosin light chain kinase family member 4-like n=1 Tax=Pristiophorus japonicus TaxID=55135 RepID=UPI00398F4CAF